MSGRAYDLAGLAYDKATILYDTGGLVPAVTRPGAAVRRTRVRRPTGFQEIGEATGRVRHLPLILHRGPVAVGRRLEQVAPARTMRRISLRMAAPLIVSKCLGHVMRGDPAQMQRRLRVSATKVEQRFNCEDDAKLERELEGLWERHAVSGGFLD